MARFFLLFLFSVAIGNCIASEWKCGFDNTWTESAFDLVAQRAPDPIYLRRCCYLHNFLYKSREQFGDDENQNAGSVFNSCLSQSQSSYTRYVVRPVYYVSVKAYGFFKQLKTFFHL